MGQSDLTRMMNARILDSEGWRLICSRGLWYVPVQAKRPFIISIANPVQPGNSGGPLLDSDASVVSVIVSKLDAIAVAEIMGDVPQNVNSAVKVQALRNFLDSAEVSYIIDDDVSAKTVTEIGAIAAKASVQINCVQ